MAPIQALEALKRPSTVRIYTDSMYVRDGITSWLPKWQVNGWVTTKKEPVKNADLWQRLADACASHKIEWEWVKGHAGHPENERADRLAVRGVLEVGGSEKRPGTPAPRPAKPDREQTSRGGEQCSAFTKAAERCRTAAGRSGLCHVHDPALQCGSITKKGKPCGVATGGGRCKAHRDIGDRPASAGQSELNLLDQ
ncbi:hypothetical protein GCM10023319_34570 [Nocardia iowensis]